MNQYLGKSVSHVFGAEGYNYSKVVFSKGRPVLDAELNLLQELQENMARRATSEMASGWITKRDPKTSEASDMVDAFYTQDPSGAIPEIALVNGWPLVVTNTGTNLDFVNKVDLSAIPLIKGSRVDGVFLEVWRALVADEYKDITMPKDVSVVTRLNGVWAVDATHAWAVGNNGVLLYSDNAGVSWISQQSPTSVDLNAVYFRDSANGYILGNAGSLFRTDNGGATWEKIALQVTDDLLAMSGVAPSFLWVVGRNGIILKSIDGTEFRQVAPGKVATDLKDVYFYDSSIGWACGASGVLLKTSSGGEDWQRIPITVPDQNGIEQTVSTSLNSVRFANLNDGWMVGEAGLILRATDGGLRWGDTSASVYDPGLGSYNRTTADLNSISVVKSFPLQITLALDDASFFRSASYTLTPTTIVLRYVRTSDNAAFAVTLNLASYATDADLVNAINALRTPVGNKRIFDAALAYTNSSYESHETTGSLYGAGSTDIRFSLGDRAWIAGSQGVVLSTTNSGAQWTVESSGTGFALQAVSFSGSASGWCVGDQGIVSHYAPSTWTIQGTDLGARAQSKVYYEGNHLASVSRNLNLDSVAPDLQVTTADRVQTQYRIRAVEGVDLGGFQEAGLGSAYVFSQGPNDNVLLAGSYAFENMGTVDGDYGLWRAKCRNTVDGYTYAIPMFLVSRRNGTPYDANSNINGATVPQLSVIRPDGLVQGVVIDEDIVDIRKTVSTVDYSQILESTLDTVLENKLRTQMWRSPEYGTQIGASVLTKDSYSTPADLNRLVTGGVNAAAVGGLTGFAGTQQDGTGIVAESVVGNLPTQAELTFPTYQNSIWDHRPSQYSAVYAGTSDPTVDGTTIPGGFTGYGTAAAQFVLGATGVLNGKSVPGLHYLITGQRIDYNTLGLSKSVDVPLSVRNQDGLSTANSVYYHAFRTDAGVVKAKEFTSAVTGVSDYLEILPLFSNNQGVPTSSATRLHVYQQPTATTGLLTVSKDYQGYSVMSVEAVISANGTLHRINRIEDRVLDHTTGNTDNSVMAIYLEDAYPVSANVIVELILGVNEVPSNSSGYLSTAVLGLKGTDRGETLSSFSNPNICAMDPRTRAVEGFYRSILVQGSLSSGQSKVTVSTPNGETIVGMAAYPTLDTPTNYHCWYTTDTVEHLSDPSYVAAKMTTVPVDMGKSVGVFGTSSLTFSLKTSSINLQSVGSVVVALYVQDRVLENSVPTATAEVYYRTAVPQALDNLPASLDIQVLQTYPSMVISSAGVGGGLTAEPYQDPLIQVPVNDSTVGTESFYFNLLGLQMQSYTESAGYTVQPLNLFRTVGGTITLSSPGSDHFGRYFYQRSSKSLVYKAQPLTLGNPRKIFVPLLVRVTSPVVSPALRGEVLLAIVSKSLNTELDNVIRLDGNDNKTAIALYRVPGMPLIRG